MQERTEGQAPGKRRQAAGRPSTPRHESESFEALLDNISRAMAHAPVHEIDGVIERWLREIVLALDIDRTTIWEFSDNQLVVAHWWGRPGVKKLPRGLTGLRVSPWANAKILAGEAIIYSNADDVADIELKQFAKTYGPTANVTLPFDAGGRIVGAMSFGRFRGPREWPPKLVRRLRVVGQIIASALDRKRTDLQARMREEEVTLAARRSTMGQLAASIAHELNQPLGAILSNVNALRRMVSTERLDPREAAAALSDIAEDTKRAGNIIRRVRALFKENNSLKAVLELGTLLSEVEGLLRSEAILRKVLLRIETAPSLPAVLGDRIQLQQCILNLVLNAFDAIGADTQRREVLVKAAQEQARWVTVSVRDTGRGIEPLVMGNLFEPFVTTKANGMGMGLLVTRSIVENHGGTIIGTSNPDVGATFTLTLPAIREHQRREPIEA
jgi:signal transduction histidine kinase